MTVEEHVRSDTSEERDPSRGERTRFLSLLRDEVARLRGTMNYAPRSSERLEQNSHSAGSAPPASIPRLPESAGDLPDKQRYSLADFLCYQDEDFVRNGYSGILRRSPDTQGFTDFIGALRAGKLSKVEILGHLRFSREGRQVGVPIDGLAVPFAVRKLRRVPVIGRLVGIAQYLVRLPDVVRNHERLEASLFEQTLDLRRRINRVVSSVEARLEQSEAGLGATIRDAGDERARVENRLLLINDALQTERNAIRSLGEDAHRLAHQLNVFDATAARADEVASRFMAVDRALESKADLDKLGPLWSLPAAVEKLEARFIEISVLQRRYQTALRVVDELGRQVHEREREFRSPQSEAAGRLEPVEAAIRNSSVESISAGFEQLYAAFEDRFRGARDDIKQRVSVYLPFVQDAGVGTTDAPVLDVGCGRGEWLELLADNGLVGHGIDLNGAMVAECEARGLEVQQADALTYLGKCDANSVGAVTGMHVIEHLTFDSCIALFEEALRVLRPGGLVVFETPNPENILVGSCSFYLDPTHKRPLPPEMIRFVAEASGFVDIEILRLHAYPESAHVTGSPGELQDRFNALLYGPQDYAVIGRKP